MAAVQLRRKDWHSSAFRTPTCVLSDSAPLGKSRPLADTPLSFTSTLSLYFCISLSSHPAIHLLAFLPFISWVFEARETPSRAIHCNRMMSVTQAEACRTGVQTVRFNTHKYWRWRKNKYGNFAFLILSPVHFRSQFMAHEILNVKLSLALFFVCLFLCRSPFSVITHTDNNQVSLHE